MRKLLIVLLILTCMLGLTACLHFPQYLPSAEKAFYGLYPKDQVLDIEEGAREIEIPSVIVDKYDVEYDVVWKSSDSELARIEKREEGVFVLLTPTTEQKKFTLTATISNEDGEKTTCTVTYNLYECLHKAGAAATCTEAQECTECGKVLVGAKGHKPGAAATCTTPQRCKTCSKVLKEKLGHSYRDDSDCTTADRCTRCGTTVVPASAGHVDVGLDGTCDNCKVVVGIDIYYDATAAVEHDIVHDTKYNFHGVQRITGENIYVYDASGKKLTLPYDIKAKDGEVVTLTIKRIDNKASATLVAGDRHTIPVCEFVVSENRTITANSDEEYITYFTGHEGKFAIYFGENNEYLGEDNVVVQINEGDGFVNVPNRYVFDIEKDQVVSFKLFLENGESDVSFAIFPAPTGTTEFYLGFETAGQTLYFNGKLASEVDGWLATTANKAEAVKVKLEVYTGATANDKLRYKLYFVVGDEKVYITLNYVSAGGRAPIELTTIKPGGYYTYDDEYRTLIYTDDNGNKHFLGAAPGDKVIASYQEGKLDENYVVHFYQ